MRLIFDISRPSYTHTHTHIYISVICVAIASGNGLTPVDAKQSPEPNLSCCQLDAWE